eukprot:gnl/TRDRNA2_/TRDRNA2_156707_c1_seq1.p1 gnl/TRDRNA2_/TRDRNA2_156707_c1~~gnl/TRDRNA2_/TRDRNA2_156707_c1_seq1.p1  ORF type:complete len:883 (+),score=217.26 gnl/TRDRNA2_/TRDRNA2_156707_c1_seq1:60-2708(+)
MSSAGRPKPKKQGTPEEEAEKEAQRQQKEDRERIRRLIITLGDDQKKVLGQIRGLVGALEDDVELHGDLMLETAVECIQNLPVKTGIFAAWTARMGTKHASFAASTVEKALEELRSALRASRAAAAQLLLRFFVCLGNCGLVALPAVLTLLREVLALSDGLRPQKGGDLGVFLTLAALPFFSSASYEKVAEEVESLISSTSTYLAGRDARWKPCLRLLKNEGAPTDRLEALASAVKSLRQAGWATQCAFMPNMPNFEPDPVGRPEAVQLTPLGLTAEDMKKCKVRFSVPMSSCRFVSGKLEADGADDQLAEHDRWLLEDYVVLIIETFARDVDECSKQLLRIPLLHPSFEVVVVECVLSQMCRLPTPPQLPMLYSRLLQAMVDKQNSMKKVVDKALTASFEQISELDEEGIDVLSEAFAYHLLHNSYEATWSPFTGDNVPLQTQRFIRRAFDRLQRLSFHENLLHKLPESVHVYVPPEPLPGRKLAVAAKPEFSRILPLIKIKEPDERTLLKYCNRLMKAQPKQEPKDDDKASGEAAAVTSVGADAENVECTKDDGYGAVEEEAEYAAADEDAAEPPAKRAKIDEKEEHSNKRPADEDEPTSAKRAKVDVKEEDGQKDVKQEPEADASATKEAAEGPEANKKEEEDPFGPPPLEPWSLYSVMELLVTALLQQGHKTPTHMCRVLDGHLQVFSKLRPKDAEADHAYCKAVVRSVFDFWRLSGQRLEITIDALMLRDLVTYRAVVEHALTEKSPQACDWMPVWNVVHSVVRKTLEQATTVRTDLALAKKLEKDDAIKNNQKLLDDAIHEVSEVFSLIFTGLVRSYQDFEEKDQPLRRLTLSRILQVGRKYHAFIKPLIDNAESRIPGVAHNPEVAVVFKSLRTL